MYKKLLVSFFGNRTLFKRHKVTFCGFVCVGQFIVFLWLFWIFLVVGLCLLL